MTDRIEAIRARHAARLSTAEVLNLSPHPNDEDMAVLLEEVERRTSALQDTARELRHRELHHFETEQMLEGVRAVLRKRQGQQYTGQLGLWRAIDAVVNPGTPEDRLRAALAPDAPDAEPPSCICAVPLAIGNEKCDRCGGPQS